MLQAIKTTYHGPTNTRGATIIACTYDEGRKTYPYKNQLSSTQNHRSAAERFAAEMKWNEGLQDRLVGGSLGKNSYVFVFVAGGEKERD